MASPLTTTSAPISKCIASAWTPAYDGDGLVRDGAWVGELTGRLDLTSWPKGIRVIVRKERPHPGAQLRFTDLGRHRFTCFATSARTGQLAGLELRHRRRARCEDRGSASPASQDWATAIDVGIVTTVALNISKGCGRWIPTATGVRSPSRS